MTRQERIDAACAACLKSESSVDAVRRAAAALHEFHVFWDTEDPKVILEKDGVAIEFYDMHS
jgi:hypothetical protein